MDGLFSSTLHREDGRSFFFLNSLRERHGNLLIWHPIPEPQMKYTVTMIHLGSIRFLPHFHSSDPLWLSLSSLASRRPRGLLLDSSHSSSFHFRELAIRISEKTRVHALHGVTLDELYGG